ncbi:IS1/IS1595 family N-terminal zinc-binding domain-containing protein, partial [Trichocoleus desertorum]|nr:IS1 family transposase [Trichocoleus sp. FACHB-46]
MQCLDCQSTHVVKNGRRQQQQNYLCRQCSRQFLDAYQPKGY